MQQALEPGAVTAATLPGSTVAAEDAPVSKACVPPPSYNAEVYVAHLSEDQINRVNKEVSVQRLLEERGLVVTSSGEALISTCPFHADTEPKLVIDRKANTWTCRGACNTSGSALDFVMRAEGISRRHALELLASGASLGHPKRRGGRPKTKEGPSHSTVRRLASPVETTADDRELLAQVVAYYHQTLKQNPEALTYLEQRGLKSMDAIDAFKLGYSNRTLGLRLPMKNRQAGAEIRARLQRLGVLRDTGHEHFRGSLVVPVVDEHGQVVQMYGRKVTPGLRPGTALHVALPEPQRALWNVAALGAMQSVIVCQSLIDGLSVWCAGYRNVVATQGFDAFTGEHAAALKAKGIEKVLIAYRRDAAGDAAAEVLAAKFMAAGMTCYRVKFPAGLDANDFVLRHAPASKTLGSVLRNATWIGKGQAPADDLESAVVAVAEQVAPEPRRPPPFLEISQRPPRRAPVPAPEPAVTKGDAPAPALELPRVDLPQRSAPAPEVAPSGGLSFEPAAPAPEAPSEVTDEEVIIQLGDRRYRVRGLARNTSFESLKVNLLVSRAGLEAGFHVDTLELYAAKARAAFIKQAAHELGLSDEVVKHDLGKVLLKLEALQEVQIRDALKPKETEVKLDEAERNAAMALLTDPKLLDRVLLDFERCGVVGEETNKVVGYLAAVSRKLEAPLAVLVQSSSAAGKTSLMEAVLAFVPDEDQVQLSAMTGQSLFYMGDGSLKHKVLAIAEEEGASRASYALKLLQSEGRLTIASTGKDPTTGRLVAQEYRVEGPVQLFLTTTAIEIDEELLNRCLVLTVDEDRLQTQAIHQLQRERQTLEGMLARGDREQVLKVHQDAQRLLRPLLVVNPYARHLTFLDDRTRTRRDHLKYLTLIRAVTLLHQYQRSVKAISHGGRTISYVEVTLEDIATANGLAHRVLGRSLDELPPQTRRLLVLVDGLVRAECEQRQIRRSDFVFSRRQLREALGWGNTQLKVHLQRLVDLEYLLVHRGPAGAHGFELLYEGQGQDGAPFLQGLLDVAQLQAHEYDKRRSAPEAEQSGPGRPTVGGEAVLGRVAVAAEIVSTEASLASIITAGTEDARLGVSSAGPSKPYPKQE